MITVENISKSFGEVQAVKDVSLVAEDGKITALLGANGAGKTTSMRMIYALITPQTGVVTVDGINSTDDPVSARARMGVLPDARGLYKRLTARENMAYFGRLQGMSEAQIKNRSGELIERLGMEKFADRQTDGFSQGQRVKVAIARAILHDPQNILLDEPTNGLDVMSTRAIRTFLREEKARGKCILFSSHVMQEVSAVCDEITVIDAGAVVAVGTEAELLAQSNQSNLEDAFVSLVTAGAGA
ncbi:ATP-binding cassette domain-containing protein [Marinicella sp. S1101]|uniref:ABC transporter ATP-binding protein n=1 Tax=Marinicella marina TaxID=2996016 RepID=UPI002260AF8B|nr:ATP-binding cassette domain-containing protein [Marinicella marina]MCX7554267.1 ATP-binding cassette domain-containing protein [Marinicella marina]MDJ1138742.1 ATP-binding cassette domain-containing protein [Marinicella marina]